MKTIHLLQINLHISPEISLKFSIVILGESEEFSILEGLVNFYLFSVYS